MPDMYFDVDTAITECPVNILPLIDATDFKTIEDAVVYNAAGMALYWHFCTSAGAYTVTAVTPTTAGDYDWTDQGAAGIYTIEIPASGGASINNDTEGYGWFTGSATGVLPWRGPVIGFRAAALNDALCDGGDNLDVNTVQWLGTACATPSVAGVPEVDLTHVAGATTNVAALATNVDAILTDTAVIGAAGVGLTAVALADATSDAVIADAVWNAATATYGAAGSYGLLVETDLDATISSRASQTSVDTVDNYIDTEIADIQSRLPAALVGGRIDASVGAVAANAITAAGIADGAIDNATFAADTGMVTVRSNTAQAGAATTITLDASASAVTDFYKNDLIVLTGGTGVGQGRYITAYNGTTKVATVATWATNPDVTSTFAIIAADAIVGATAPTASEVADEVQTRTIAAVTVVNGLAAGVVTAAAIATDAIDSDALAASAITEIQAGLATPTNITAATGVVLSGVTHTGAVIPTVTTLTGHTAQTGDSFARIGATGSGLTSLATQASVNTIDDLIDTEIADIQNRLPAALVGGRMDASVGAVASDTDAVTRLERVLSGNVTFTVGAASTTTSVVTSAMDPAAAVTDQFKGRILTFDAATTTANLRGQSTDITASTAAGVLTVTALTTAAVSGDTGTIS